MISYGNGIAILSWNGERGNASFKIIRRPDSAHPENIIDDAKIGPNDGLFLYSIYIPPSGLLTAVPQNQSTLFGIFDRTLKVLLPDLQLGNGLGFSGDGEYIYHSDTVLRITYKSVFDRRTNSISTVFQAIFCFCHQ